MNRQGCVLIELPIFFFFAIAWLVATSVIAFSCLPFYLAIPAIFLSPFALMLALIAVCYVVAVPVWIVETFLSRCVRPGQFRRRMRRINDLDEREAEDPEYSQAFERLDQIAQGMNPRDYHFPVRDALLHGEGESRSRFLRFAAERSDVPVMRGVVAEIAANWSDPLGREAREVTQKWEAEAGSGPESRTPPPPQERPTGR